MVLFLMKNYHISPQSSTPASLKCESIAMVSLLRFSAAAAARQSLIKSWICYSTIFRLEPLHNWFMHRTHFLYELNTQLDLKLTRLPWSNFKLTGKFLNYVSSYNKYNRRTFTRKISVFFVPKWPPLTPVMTCLILAGAVRKITKSGMVRQV